MGLWDLRFGYVSSFFFSFIPAAPERVEKEVKIRIAASILYFVINNAIE